MLTSAQMGSVITAATPAFMVVFGCLMLHERFNLSRLMSVILATAGVLLIVVDPENLQTGSLLGGINYKVLMQQIHGILYQTMQDYCSTIASSAVYSSREFSRT